MRRLATDGAVIGAWWLFAIKAERKRAAFLPNAFGSIAQFKSDGAKVTPNPIRDQDR
jgi:hypothetical protein